jgi:hypothetical protein
MGKRCFDFDLDLTFETFKRSLETKGVVGYCSVDDVLGVRKMIDLLQLSNICTNVASNVCSSSCTINHHEHLMT